MEMTGITRLTDDVYYGWVDGEPSPVFWHWCSAAAALPAELTVSGGWRTAGTPAHTLVSRDPLHLEPSLLWTCCGMHGWVRAGRWDAA